MPPRPPNNLLSLPHTIRPLLLTARPIHTTPTPHSSPVTSVNPTEVSHFNALASSWWDAHGPSRLLHLMNPLRHTFISSCLASQPDAHDTGRKLRYLDVGCGGGIFAESAARLRNVRGVTAVDPSGEVLAVAKAHARRDPGLGGRLTYLNIGVEELHAHHQSRKTEGAEAAAHEGYDVVTLFEVIEHVDDPASFLASITSHVKPGGWLVLSTIARTWTSWATTKVMAEDVLRIVPRGTHDWKKYVNEYEVRKWFEEQNGWTGLRAMGVIYVPGIGWMEVRGGEDYGNYFFGARKALV